MWCGVREVRGDSCACPALLACLSHPRSVVHRDYLSSRCLRVAAALPCPARDVQLTNWDGCIRLMDATAVAWVRARKVQLRVGKCGGLTCQGGPDGRMQRNAETDRSERQSRRKQETLGRCARVPTLSISALPCPALPLPLSLDRSAAQFRFASMMNVRGQTSLACERPTRTRVHVCAGCNSAAVGSTLNPPRSNRRLACAH